MVEFIFFQASKVTNQLLSFAMFQLSHDALRTSEENSTMGCAENYRLFNLTL